VDLKQITYRRMKLDEQLHLLEIAKGNDQQITVVRGRLIVALQREEQMQIFEANKEMIRKRIQTELIIHKAQTKRLLVDNKEKNQPIISNVAKELGLRFKNIKTDIKQGNYADTPLEATTSLIDAAGQSAMILFTIIKTPIVITLNMVGTIAPYAMIILVQPLHLIGLAYSKVVNPHTPYDKTIINQMGNKLGTSFKNALIRSGKVLKKV